MRKVARTILAAMFAVLAFGAIAASNALAAHPQFLTASGKTLLFVGESSKPVLRGEAVATKTPAAVECEKALVHGFILNASPLAHLKAIVFHGKCVQKVNGGINETCNEPIETKTILAELGLISSTTKTVAVLLAPDDGTTEFAKFTCGLNTTTVRGAIVGEIPALNAARESQYNVERETLEVIFATSPAGSDKQAITEIELLGTQMKGNELKAEGFLGGPGAAEEATSTLKSDGKAKLDV